ncbi:hypothetical protein LCGC14_1302010 [marine sediment metagenome]|uniref:Uncharacterized protein n=1 Tax=marine sediment metagenome TaxID=412755 RepID=A0A0F9KQN2_9ZZZZ
MSANLLRAFFMTLIWQIYELYLLLLLHKALNATFGHIFFVNKTIQKKIKSKKYFYK